MIKVIVVQLSVLLLINFIIDTKSAESIVPVLPFPKWPPTCCFSIAGCDEGALSKYCPPCPYNCAEINKCDCYFPGTKEIIKRRPTDKTPRPPFCQECPQRKCQNTCSANLTECLLDNARAFIAL